LPVLNCEASGLAQFLITHFTLLSKCLSVGVGGYSLVLLLTLLLKSPDFLSHGNFPSKKVQDFHVQSELSSLVLDSFREHSGKFIQLKLETEAKWVLVSISKMGHHSPNGPINAQILLVTIGHDHSSNFAPQGSYLITIFEV
jgi:hypothetical protein